MKIKEVRLKKCQLCHKYFEVNINNKRSNNKRFCSGFCAKKHNGLNNKGKKRTDEFKKKLSLKNIGENNPFYGKNHSKESLLKMSISLKWKEDKYKYCNLTDKDMEIFDGIMISDGHLDRSRISSRITLGFKYRETLERIISDLSSLTFLNIFKYVSVDKRTKNTYVNYYTKTNFFRNLLFEHERWYKNEIKIIPDDFRLTKLSCYWWYVCDGFISKNNNVYLCTESFDKLFIEKISTKINNIGFKNSITSRNRIRFYKKDSEKFLKWISNDVNIQKEYLYKWDIKK